MVFSGRRVFSESLRMMKERIGPLLGLIVFFFVLQVVMMGLLVAVFGTAMFAGLASMNPQAGALPAMGVGMILMIISFYIVYLMLAFAQYGALSSMASPLQRRTFSEALGDGFRSAPTILGVAVVAMIGYLLFAIVLGLVSAALVAVAGTGGSVIALVISLVALIYFASRFVPILPAVAVEGIRNPLRALSRAWSLTRGNAIKIVLINVAFLIVIAVLLGASFVPFIGMFQNAATPGAVPNFGSMGLFFLLVLFAGVLVMIFASAFQAAIHSELAGHAGENFAQTFE